MTSCSVTQSFKKPDSYIFSTRQEQCSEFSSVHVLPSTEHKHIKTIRLAEAFKLQWQF